MRGPQRKEFMSCWVVPTVAADFWGITLDIVWRRIYEGLVPHKIDRGFVFIDVDPWTADINGHPFHEPPPTFVSAEESALSDPLHSDLSETIEAAEPELSIEDRTGQATEGIEEDSVADDEAVSSEEDHSDNLPDLDEEEVATFGRLSWQEVRSQVSRTRRPPPCRV